jgi:hypothetical protein
MTVFAEITPSLFLFLFFPNPVVIFRSEISVARRKETLYTNTK